MLFDVIIDDDGAKTDAVGDDVKVVDEDDVDVLGNHGFPFNI